VVQLAKVASCKGERDLARESTTPLKKAKKRGKRREKARLSLPFVGPVGAASGVGG
jgi:hypothetical protein